MGIPLERLVEWEADRTHLSPNWSARPAAVHAIRMAVVHGTADEGNEAGAEQHLTTAHHSPALDASAHLLIKRDGTTVRLVPDRRKAWHAGRSEWRLYPTGERVGDCNRMSLGWELCNRCDGVEPYTDAQYETVARIAAWYVRHGLELENIAGHEAVALPHGRKVDPGPAFDWPRFRVDTLLLLYPDPPPTVAAQIRALRTIPPNLDAAA